MPLWEPTEEQRALAEAVGAFGTTLNEGLARRDAESIFDREAWRRCAELGILGLPIPKAYGGSGQDLFTNVLVMMALGRSCRDNGLVFSLNAQLWAFELPLLHFGTEAQKARYLPAVVRGEWIGAHAVTEPEHGSDAMSMTTRARRDGDGYLLDGAKTFVTNGPVADVFIVFATVNPRLKAAGVTAFLVERDTPGLVVSRPMHKLGIRTSPTGELALEGCRVPASNRLGGEGAGLKIFNSAMEWERTCIFAAHLGAMERLLEDTAAYARARQQFGVPIAKHPEVANALVDMKVSVEAGRLLLYRAVQAKASGEDAVLYAAIAKLFVSEAHVRQALAAIQVHGGYGVTTEFQIERELRDAIPGTLYSGTTEMQRKIIARRMGL